MTPILIGVAADDDALATPVSAATAIARPTRGNPSLRDRKRILIDALLLLCR
ncbi:MAG TPA: hypothetical protein VGK92_09490 [Gaiellales bacterium]